MGGFLGGWFGGPVRRMVPAYHPPVFDGEDARAVQSPRRRCARDTLLHQQDAQPQDRLRDSIPVGTQVAGGRVYEDIDSIWHGLQPFPFIWYLLYAFSHHLKALMSTRLYPFGRQKKVGKLS